MFEIIYWGCIGIVIYTYAGYALILFLLSMIIRRPVQQGPYEPTVAFIIPAYNEASVIEEKIRNTLSLDYPKEKLTVIVASDGSTDGTNDTARRYRDRSVILIESGHIGKTRLLNSVVAQVNSEIIVFSDASGMLNKKALTSIVRNFFDREIGCVCGIYHIIGKEKSLADKFEEHYLSFDTMLRKSESIIYTTLGSPGALYAIRRKLFKPLREDIINEDFLISSNIVLQGYRTVYEEGAHVYDKISTTIRDEFRRRVRIAAGNVQHLFLVKEFFKAKRYYIVLLFISHRITRLLAPFLLLILFVGSIALEGLLYKIILSGFAALFALSIFGWIFPARVCNGGLLYVPLYLVLGHIAYMTGVYKFLFARKTIRW